MKPWPILDPEARAEFDEAYDYYQGKRFGLGEAFADAVQAAFDRITAMPRMYRIVFRDIRRAIVNGFPYCIYYREEANQFRVLAVFHSSRNPKIWQGRASREPDAQ